MYKINFQAKKCRPIFGDGVEVHLGIRIKKLIEV
jgi:hypothetical protein